ncbi:hypothetical protein SUGI_0001200 [Cryptomeria japonica]|uniref:uncharacterized protein LOC131036680 n=1 Tax=Cryptomeria japonica TaxID=3369 RepID=UPI002408B97D|nr:uncharacterized protein LOC131036680 [Cryptomeria japonica]GLJ04681.1 hypothetical protein SUGI_0001200 [Cryptomeria japonica]
MDSHDSDLDLLLSLNDHVDRVAETPPHSHASGYFSEEDMPRHGKALGMAAFKDVVKDSVEEEDAKLKTPATSQPQKTLDNNLKSHSTNDVEVERYSGLRIRNRMVSTMSMTIRFSDVRFIRLQAISTAMMGDNITGSWATVGVLTEKGNPRLSSNGKNFAIWKLSSLDSATISLFLFGDAYTRHWKESPGSILSIFNAKVRREDKGNEFSLSVFAVDQIVKLGTSVDYGLCKAKRKDGMPCTMIINRSRGSYCQYHVAATRQKYTTKRAELSGGNLSTAFRKPLKSEGIYMVKPLGESSNNNKPSRPMKVMTTEDLRKTLSNADKVTTKHQSQGIRFLSSVANAENMDPKATVRKSDLQMKKVKQYEEYLKKRPSSTIKPTGVLQKHEPEAKRKKTVQNPDDLIELDIDV